jgi:hypothetical protein
MMLLRLGLWEPPLHAGVMILDAGVPKHSHWDPTLAPNLHYAT